MNIWIWIIRVVNSVVLTYLIAMFIDLREINFELKEKKYMLFPILLISFIFTLLIYPICSYLEKKLKD